VAASFSITQCPTPAGIAGEPYSSGLAVVGGESPVQWAILSGSLPRGLALEPNTGTITGTPDQPGTSDFVVRAQDRANIAATRSCSIVVGTPGLRISGPDQLQEAVLGAGYGQELQATGGAGPYRWSVADGALPQGVALSPAGRIEGVPQQTGAFPLTVRVLDTGAGVATRAFNLRVVPGAAPSVSFGDLPEIVAPAQQPRVALSLASAYPVDLRCRVAMTFTPDPGIDVDDKSIQFAGGGRSAEFQIPAGATEPTAPLALQTGTVAGTIELRVELLAGQLDVTPSPAPVKRIRIDRTAPVISSVRMNRTDTGFELLVTGYSTTRDVSAATFVFTPASGSRLNSSEIRVDTTEAARRWYSNPASADFGSQFTFTQPFSVSGATISEVGVTLTNGQGTSAQSRTRF
jgi:hypothetical protein